MHQYTRSVCELNYAYSVRLFCTSLDFGMIRELFLLQIMLMYY